MSREEVVIGVAISVLLISTIFALCFMLYGAYQISMFFGGVCSLGVILFLVAFVIAVMNAASND